MSHRPLQILVINLTIGEKKYPKKQNRKVRWFVGPAGWTSASASAALLQRQPLAQYFQYSLEMLLKIRSNPLMSRLGDDYRFAQRECATSTVAETKSILSDMSIWPTRCRAEILAACVPKPAWLLGGLRSWGGSLGPRDIEDPMLALRTRVCSSL